MSKNIFKTAGAAWKDCKWLQFDDFVPILQFQTTEKHENPSKRELADANWLHDNHSEPRMRNKKNNIVELPAISKVNEAVPGCSNSQPQPLTS